MNNFNFYSPTEFVFGKDREIECGDYVIKHGGSKVLLHYGSSSAKKSGLLDRVQKSLQNNLIQVEEKKLEKTKSFSVADKYKTSQIR